MMIVSKKVNMGDFEFINKMENKQYERAISMFKELAKPTLEDATIAKEYVSTLVVQGLERLDPADGDPVWYICDLADGSFYELLMWAWYENKDFGAKALWAKFEGEIINFLNYPATNRDILIYYLEQIFYGILRTAYFEEMFV